MFAQSVDNLIFSSSALVEPGFNPYFKLAEEVGCNEELHGLVLEYLHRQISFKDLITEEERLVCDGFENEYGRFPHRGDFENLISRIPLTKEAESCLSILKDQGKSLFVVSLSFSTYLETLPKSVVARDRIHANDLFYSEDGEFAKFAIQVEGDKIATIGNILHSEGKKMMNTGFVASTPFDREAMQYVLTLGGTVFWVNGQSSLPSPKLPSFARLFEVESVDRILDYLG